MEHHKIFEPIKEVVGQVTDFVIRKALGGDLFSDIFNDPDNSPLDEPVFKQPDFGYDSEGNWHNPTPDIQGKDL